MRISEIRDTVVPVRSAMRNAAVSFAEMTTSAVAIHTDAVRGGKPVIGYGFNAIGRYAQQRILRDRMIPRLLRAAPESLLVEAGANFDAHKAWAVMMTNEKPGGHGDRSFAVGAMDMALWDVIAKIERKPLYLVLADRYRDGQADERIAVYAAGGYYDPGKGVQGLRDEIRGYLDSGYATVKIKIGGAPLAEDLRRIEAVLSLVPSGEHLAVDANGRFDLTTALRYAHALEPYRLKWYEEPGDPLDFQLLAEVAKVSTTPLATGENLFGLEESRNLIRYGGLNSQRDFLQMDPALGYGLVEYLRILEMLRDAGWPARRCVAHGGNQLCLHIAVGLGLGGSEAYPGVFLPFGGFADEPPVENGFVRLPDAPGVGIELNSDLYEVFRQIS
jgi:D(-)-tartrate dehydratase